MTARRALGVLLAAASGFAIAVQARINGELAVRLGDGIMAGLVSFGTGLALLLVLVPATATGRRGLRAVGAALRDGQLRWWHLLGGICGGFVVASQGLTVATIGVAVFTVALVAGQTSSSLAVDRAGVGPSGVQPVTGTRMLGAVLCVVAVVVSVADQFDTPDALGLAVLPLLAGAGVAWQQAVNGRVRVASGSVRAATLVNFLAGGAALLVGTAGSVLVRGWPSGHLPSEPWLYVGGLLGVFVIAVGAAVVRLIGVLLLALGTVSGQVVGAVVVDLVAPAVRAPALTTYLGATLALLAVLVALSPTRRGRTRSA